MAEKLFSPEQKAQIVSAIQKAVTITSGEIQVHIENHCKGDVLDRVEADELPSEAEFVSSLDSRRQFDKAPPLEASEEQLKTFAARNAPKRVTPEAPAAAGVAPVAYPPLESSGAAQ